MSPRRDANAGGAHASAQDVWILICDVVFANVRRREASEALGLSFGRIRAIRRLARGPMSMGELAAALTIEAPNATVVVDDLEARGLARRVPHASDRRAKVVELTREGQRAAARADAILGTPPAALNDVADEDLATLQRILGAVKGA